MTEGMTPIVIDLGKTQQKRIKQLKRGQGPLRAEVADVIRQVQEELGADVEGKELVPVVIVYRRKQKKRSRASWFSL